MATTNNGAGGQGNTETTQTTEKPAGEQQQTADKTSDGAASKQEPEPGKAGTDGKSGDDTSKQSQDGKDGKGGGDDKGGKKTGAPEKYELKVPENSTLGDDDVATIEKIARENGWDNETAQAALEQHHNTLIEQSARFLEATKADKDYGGDKLTTTQARAKSVIDLVRPTSHPRAKAFRALLDKSGFGNHIEVISFLADLGKMTEEDGALAGGGGAEKRDAADVLYGGTTKTS